MRVRSTRDLRRRLSDSQEQELLHLLAGPAGSERGCERNIIAELVADRSVDPLIRNVVHFHIIGHKRYPRAMKASRRLAALLRTESSPCHA